MRSVSENYLDYINSSLVRRPKSKFVIDNVHYEGNEFLVTYPKMEHKTDKAIGSFPAKTCELQILNRDGTFDLHGKEVTVYRGLDIGGTTEWVRIGVFMASDDNIKTNINKKTITFKGTDKTQLLDKPYGGAAQWEVSKRILHIVKDICTRNGIELASAEFPMNDYTFPDIPPGLDFDNITERQMIAYIAELGGSIAMFTHNGKLAFKKPSDTGVTFPKTKYKSLSVENAFGPVNAVSFGHSSYEDSLLYEQDGVTDDTRVEWAINDNPLTTTTDKNNLIQAVSEHFFGRSFVPFEVEDIIDDYLFDLNDTVTIEKKDGSTVTVTLLELATSSRMKSKFGAALQTPGKTNTALAGSVKERLGKVELIVDHQNNTIQSLADNGETMKTSIEQNAEAISAHTKKIETIETAGYITESAAQSLINASAESIELSVTQNLKIGTRNILLDSACFGSFTAKGYYANVISEKSAENTIYPSGRVKMISMTPTDNAGDYIGLRYYNADIIGEEDTITKIKAGQTYTLSFWLSDYEIPVGETRALSRTRLIAAGTDATVTYSDNSELLLTDTPQKFAVTFTISGTISKFVLLFARKLQEDDLVASFRLSSLKLEEGNVATDWTPSVQDIEQTVEAKLELCVQTDADGNLQSAIHAKANQITIETDNFTLDGEGNVTCNNANITGGIINIGNEESCVLIEDGILTIYQNDFHLLDIKNGLIKSIDSDGVETLTSCARFEVPGGAVFASAETTIVALCDDGTVNIHGSVNIEGGVKSKICFYDGVYVENFKGATAAGTTTSGISYAWVAVNVDTGELIWVS